MNPIETIEVFNQRSLYLRFIPESPTATASANSRATLWNNVQREEIPKLTKAIMHWQEEGCGCFFLVNQAKGNGQSTSNISHITSFFIDADGGSLDPIYRYLPESTLKIETSPGKYHIYWLLKDHIEVTEETKNIWSTAQERLALIDPSYDISMTDVTQIMRLPGTNHLKRDPFKVQVIKQSNVRYDFNEFVEISKTLPIAERPQLHQLVSISGDNDVRRFRELTAEDGKLTEPNRHEHLIRYLSYKVGTNSSLTEQELKKTALDYIDRHFEGGKQLWIGPRNREFNNMIQYAMTQKPLYAERKKQELFQDIEKQEPIQEKISVNGNGANDDNGEDDYPEINYKQNPVTIARLFGDNCREVILLHEYNLIFNGKYWGNAKKVWEPVLSKLRKFIIDNRYNYIPVPKIKGGSEGQKYLNKEIRTADLDEVMRNIKIDLMRVTESPKENTWLDEDLQSLRPNCIGVQNGILDMDRRELLPFSPMFYCTGLLPVRFDAKAQCPFWEDTLSKFLAGDSQSIRELQKFYGYVLYPSTFLKKIMVMVGQANTGKSFMGWVLQSTLGNRYCTSYSKETIRSGFGTAGMEVAKLAYVDDYDLSSISQSEVDYVKKVTSGSGTEIQHKGVDKFMADVTARVLYTTNSLPEKFIDRMGAFTKRIVVIQTEEIPEEHRKPSALSKESIQAERSGILNWILDGIVKLKEDGTVNTPEASKAALEIFKNSGRDVIEAFIEDCLEATRDIQEKIPTATIREKFLNYLKLQDWVSNEDFDEWGLGKDGLKDYNYIKFCRNLQIKLSLKHKQCKTKHEKNGNVMLYVRFRSQV